MKEVEAAVQNLSSRFEIETLSGSCANVASVFLHSIGLEALDVCNTFVFGAEESKDKLEDNMKNFEEHTIPKFNVVYERE